MIVGYYSPEEIDSAREVLYQHFPDEARPNNLRKKSFKMNDQRSKKNVKDMILVQARSQKFAMGGLFWGSGGGAPSRRRPMGVWGRSPQPPEAGGLGAKPPAAGGTGVWGRSPQRSKILHFFCKNNFILGLF